MKSRIPNQQNLTAVKIDGLHRTGTTDKCPCCDGILNARGCASSGFGLDEKSPEPTEGDVTICAHCGNLLLFGKDLALELCPEEKKQELMEDEGMAAVIKAATMYGVAMKSSKDISGLDVHKMWVLEIQKLSEKMREYVGLHPGSNIQIQYNFPENIPLIATFKQAVDLSFITMTPDARLMLEHAGVNLVKDIPEGQTITMIKTAAELAFGDNQK